MLIHNFHYPLPDSFGGAEDGTVREADCFDSDARKVAIPLSIVSSLLFMAASIQLNRAVRFSYKIVNDDELGVVGVGDDFFTFEGNS